MSQNMKKVLIVVLVLLTLSLVAIMVYRAWETPPEVTTGGLNDTTITDENDEDISVGETGTEIDTGRSDTKYNILVAGRDLEGANTDTIMIVSLDTAEHTIDVISIPRDTMVNVAWDVKKINTVYGAGIMSGYDGAEYFMEKMADILGFSLDAYAIVNLSAFEEMVDAIGGIYFDVPIDMYYEDYVQNLLIDIDAGYQLLDGKTALEVMRFRSGYSDADIGRISTQQDLALALAKQLLDLGNIPNLSNLINIVVENVETDLSAANISFLVREFLACDLEDINFYTMPGDYSDSKNGISYVTIYLDEWLEMVNEYINPWDTDVTIENVNILTRIDGYIAATTGVISGGDDSFYSFSTASGDDEDEEELDEDIDILDGDELLDEETYDAEIELDVSDESIDLTYENIVIE